MLPQLSIVLTSELPVTELRDRLARVTAPPSWFPFDSPGAAFVGNVEDTSFEIRRCVNRNGFVGVVSGSIDAWKNGSRVRLTVRLNALATIFMSIWLTGVTVLAIDGGCSALRPGGHGDLWPLIGLPFGALAWLVALALETHAATTRLCSLLDASESES